MLQGFSVENFRSIDNVSIPDLRIPAVFSAENGRDPGDIRDSILLAARSFPGGRDGSHLLTEGVSPFEDFAENMRGSTSLSGVFRECVQEGPSFSEPFRECSREGASFISMSHTWVLMNPENEIVPGFADKKRSGAGEFREICRLFGERFGVVRQIVLKNEVTFESRPLSEAGNILSYQMLEVTVDRAFKAPITGFYELVVYPGGTNYDLYWDTLPDVHRIPVTGRAKGCNIRMSGLEIRNIVTDGVQDGADFDMILPTVMRLSEYPGRMFRGLVHDEAGSGASGGSQMCAVEGADAPRTWRQERRGILESGFGKIEATKRIPWIAPDGELVHSVTEEAIDTWFAYINGTDRGKFNTPQSAEEEGGWMNDAAGVAPGLLAALLLAPVGGTILLEAPLSSYESGVRTRFLAFAAAQAKLEKSILIAEGQMRK